MTVSGLLVLYNNMLRSLFASQISTLGAVLAGVGVMLLLLFRSPTLAVLGIVPNLLAAGAVLGMMGLAGIPLDLMTITVAAITVGIAVDNAIHYIYRFREEFAKSGDYAGTLRICHANIGKAVFYTSATVVFGFSILVLSNFLPTIYFGLLTGLAMSIALLAALTLLPKLILLTRPFGRSTPGQAERHKAASYRDVSGQAASASAGIKRIYFRPPSRRSGRHPHLCPTLRHGPRARAVVCLDAAP